MAGIVHRGGRLERRERARGAGEGGRGGGGEGGGEFVGDWIEFSSILIRSLVGGIVGSETASSLVLSLLEPS